jgi:hypothetical protein
MSETITTEEPTNGFLIDNLPVEKLWEVCKRLSDPTPLSSDEQRNLADTMHINLGQAIPACIDE